MNEFIKLWQEAKTVADYIVVVWTYIVTLTAIFGLGYTLYQILHQPLLPY